MITVVFEDDGQDFLEWDIDEEKGKVVACRPFQSDTWVGTYIHNKNIKPGDYLAITPLLANSPRALIHRVLKVLEMA